METIPTTEVEQSKIQPLGVELKIELMGEEVRTIDSEVGTKPLVVV
jgi:hypothetical protein